MRRLSWLTLAFSVLFAIFITSLPFLSRSFGPYPLMKTQDAIDLFTPLVLIPVYWLLFRLESAKPPSAREIIALLASTPVTEKPAAPTVAPSRSVRSTGEQPRFVTTSPEQLIEETATHARAALDRTGTLAVIAPAALHGQIIARLADVGASSDASEALDAPVAVLEPAEAKGLEFDHVVVVEPADLVTADRAGLRLLYVTIPRTTKTLTVVHARPLPEGLAPRG